MVGIPLEAIPNQQFEVILDSRNCTVKLYQRGDKLYMDLAVDNSAVFYGAICEDRNPILRRVATSFKGNLAFIDTLGSNDPRYSLLNSRYYLVYFSGAEELANV